MNTLFSAKAIKAWLAAITAAIGAGIPAASDGSISLVDGLVIAGAFIGALSVVYGVPNDGSKGTGNDRTG